MIHHRRALNRPLAVGFWYARERPAAGRRSVGRPQGIEVDLGARLFLGLFGLVSVLYGVFCLLRPGFLDAFAGVAATSTTGTVELRAMYGGLQTAFGVLALLGALRPAFTHAALLATAVLCAGLGSFRLLGAIAASELSSYTGQGLVFELGATAVAVMLLRRLPR
jgi:hypothetical protein